MMDAKLPKQRILDFTWKHHSIICFFYYHPLLEKRNATVCSKVFNVMRTTLLGWATKEHMVVKFVEYTKNTTVADVLSCIPQHHKDAASKWHNTFSLEQFR